MSSVHWPVALALVPEQAFVLDQQAQLVECQAFSGADLFALGLSCRSTLAVQDKPPWARNLQLQPQGKAGNPSATFPGSMGVSKRLAYSRMEPS